MRSAALCLCLWTSLVFQQVSAQKCQLPLDTRTPLPDVFEISKSSYGFLVEANYDQLKRTHYITEIYDIKKMRGRLDMEMGNDKVTIVYYNETNEFFEATSTKCESKKLSEVDPSFFEEKYLGWNFVNVDPKNTLIGPSNLLRMAYLQSQFNPKTITLGKEPNQELVRDMLTNVWTWCYDRERLDLKVQFYFTDPKAETPFGVKGVAVPVRVTVTGTHNNQPVKEYFEFVGMKKDFPDMYLDEYISIPATVGCKRLAEKEQKIAPDYSKKGAYVEAEMVYKPFKDNPDGYTYTTNFKVAADVTTYTAELQYSPWKTHKDNQAAKPGNQVKRIFDLMNIFTFETDLDEGTCIVKKPDNPKFTTFTLPDGYEIDLADWDLFFSNSKPSQCHYLGETRVRDIPASIFEKRVENDLETLTITRYISSDGVVIDNTFHEKSVPLKVVVWRIDLEPGQFIGELTVNLYNYASVLEGKNDLFDVTACFPKKEQSKWIQVIFPMNGNKVSDVAPMIPFIQDNMFGLLRSMGAGLQRYRLPRILADVDQDSIYVTALILERPEFLLDFKGEEKKTVKSTVTDKTLVGLKTESGCAKACLLNPLCQAFTYCGAQCTLIETSVDSTTDAEQNDGCKLYIALSDDPGMLTMDEVTKAIARKIQSKELKISLPKKDGNFMDFTALLLRDDVAFGINGLRETPEGTDQVRFSVYKPGSKMVDTEADEGSNMGRLSLEACQKGCGDKDNCQSFSYCVSSRQCLLSSKHGEEFKPGELQANTQCGTYSRNYQDYFIELPGISIDHEAEKVDDKATVLESCAKSCIKEEGFKCKSFDFCPGDGKDAVNSCLLHKEHFTEMKEEKHVKVSGNCGHYSRKYLMDFTQKPHQDMSKAEAGAVITNVTAEDCAKYCRDNEGFDCLAFDHCYDFVESSSICTLRKTNNDGFVAKDICNVYIRTDKAKPRPKRETVKVTESESGHSKSSTGGLGFLMLLIGLGLGFGGMLGYGFWKMRRNQ